MTESSHAAVTPTHHWGYVYKITETATGRAFVGVHDARATEIDGEFYGQSDELWDAFSAHGAEAFERKILAYVGSPEEGALEEVFTLALFLSLGVEMFNKPLSGQVDLPAAILRNFDEPTPQDVLSYLGNLSVGERGVLLDELRSTFGLESDVFMADQMSSMSMPVVEIPE